MKTLIIFFGTDDFSVPSLEALIDQRYQITGVVTKPDLLVGRGRQVSLPAVKTLAQRSDIPVLQPAKLLDAVSDMQAFMPELGIVVSFGKIIPHRILELFPGGLINVHASLLPKYRGPSPIEAAILNGDLETGITLMRLTEDMDEGPIYAQKKVKLDGSETKPVLRQKLSKLGARFLIEHLPNIVSGKLQPIPQDNEEATYCKLIKKEDGRIDWSQPARLIERQIRAYLGWPGSITTIGGRDVVVTRAHVSTLSVILSNIEGTRRSGQAPKTDTDELAMTCGRDTVLIIDRLKPSGKREMTGADFVRGYLRN